MTRYAIGLGSNVGDRLQHLIDAIGALSGQVTHIEVSSLYESEPVGGPDQDPFLNAVAVVETELSASDLLDRLHHIEEAHDREREVRWGPRTLDLDIVASDGPVISTESLIVPHPRASEREFVLKPLRDVWPGALVGDGVSLETALGRLEDQGVDYLAKHWLPPVSSRTAYLLLAGQFSLILAVAVALAYDGSLPEGVVTPWRGSGAVMALVGMVLAFIASRRLGTSMTASPLPKPEGQLVASGPYRYARHPIYGGLTMFLMGTSLFLDSLVGFFVAAALIPYFLMKARYEERQLRMRFAGYLAYKREVPRWLIPFVT